VGIRNLGIDKGRLSYPLCSSGNGTKKEQKISNPAKIIYDLGWIISYIHLSASKYSIKG
jgi:hypothetical protein